jgi:hypothetical protein
MKEQNTANNNKQNSVLEDLTVSDSEAIKGGPKKIFIGGLSVKEEPASSSGPMPQTREHILLARQVG